MSFQNKFREVKNQNLIEYTLTDQFSSSYIPISMNDLSEVDIELLSPLTLDYLKKNHTRHDIITVEDDPKINTYKIEDKLDRRGFFEAFNNYFYRKINDEIISYFPDNDTSIHYLYKQDVDQKIYGKRYILRCNYAFNEAISINSVFDPTYFIFDTQTNTNYQSFKSVSLILKAIEFNKTHKPTVYMLKGMTEQEYLDISIKKLVLKIRK